MGGCRGQGGGVPGIREGGPGVGAGPPRVGAGGAPGSWLHWKPPWCPPWLGTAPRLLLACVPLCFLILPSPSSPVRHWLTGLFQGKLLTVACCPWAHPAPTPGSGLTWSASRRVTLVPSSLSALCPPAPPTARLQCTLGPQRPPSTDGLPPACSGAPTLWFGRWGVRQEVSGAGEREDRVCPPPTPGAAVGTAPPPSRARSAPAVPPLSCKLSE